ncbi:MAG: toll/interleukin-1 receptor domain-containing protein [Hyphomicrobiales bacterium]|nr:toll/interleukin-1 receptor domain-containing protein [Hyphomicrobiales bacterium]
MPAIFISHSSRDRQVSDDIRAELGNLGFEQVFLDFDKDSGIGAGENWERRLYEELNRCHAVILVLTPGWLASTWCRIELAQARALGKVILPVICAPLGDTFVLPEVQAVDLVGWKEGGIERLAQRLNAITSELARGFKLHPDRSPYPGIHAFEAEDAAIYFGRDDETRAVLERLDARRTQGGARLLLIIGASGSGKSSLLRAGILPQLARRKREWLALPPLRPEKAPLEVLAKTIAAHIGKPEDWRGWHARLGADDAADQIDDLLKDLRIGEARNATVLLPLDQLEEVFTVATPAERGAFMRLLAACLDPARDLPLMVLATGRSDVLEGLISGGGELARLTETFPLPLLPLDRVPRLVEGPATVAGINVEAGLAERIARDVESAEALPLLAHALWLLHRRGGKDKRLTLAEYEALGDAQRGLHPIANSVRLVADQAIAGLKPTAQELAALRDAFVPHLVRIRPEDGKRVRQAARIAEHPSDASRLVRALVQARLLTARGDGGDGELVEVTHEALFKAWPELDQWLTEEQSFLIDLERIRGAHEVWAQAATDQRTQALLRGLLLTRARDWMLRYPQRFLGRDLEPLRAFIVASTAAEDEERARAAAQEARTRRMERLLFRGALAATLVMAVLAGGAGVAAWMAVKSEERAQRNFELTIDHADALVSKTATELKDRLGISQDVIRRMLALIERQMDVLAKVDQRSPRLAVSRANMLAAFADNYTDLGDLEKAKERAQECVEVARPLQSRSSQEGGDPEAVHALATCLHRLGAALSARSLLAESLAAYRESIALRRRLLAADPQNPASQAELGRVLTYYAFVVMNAGNHDEAIERARESVALTRRLAELDRGNTLWMREFIDSLNAQGMVLQGKGELGEAAQSFSEAVRIGRQLVDADRGNATLQRFLSNILANLSDVLLDAAYNEEALKVLAESLSLKRRLNAADGDNAIWAYELSATLNKIGRAQFALEKPEAAIAAWDESRARFALLLRRDPGNALHRWWLADCLLSLAFVNGKRGDVAAARARAEEGIALIDAFVAVDANDAMAIRLSGMKGQFADILSSLPGPNPKSEVKSGSRAAQP